MNDRASKDVLLFSSIFRSFRLRLAALMGGLPVESYIGFSFNRLFELASLPGVAFGGNSETLSSILLIERDL
jgi:hypothetical protein